MQSYCDKINNILASGGTIVVSTGYRATEYSKRHAGWFSVGADGNLYVKHGKGRNCLSNGNGLLVKITAYSS